MKKFIAYFDILGYGKRIERKTLDEEYQIQKELGDEIIGIIKKNANTKVPFHTIQFSDTHIFYTEDASEDAFEIIVKSSLVFMLMAAVRTRPYLPLRGTINYGDFRADHDNFIFVGKALREAYILEKSQKWMGCLLTEACHEKVQDFKIFEMFLKKYVLIKYDVPFNNSVTNKYVVNMESFPRLWGDKCKNMPLTDPKFIENIFVNKGGKDDGLLELDERAREKLKNTQDFFIYIKNNFHNKVEM